MIFSNEFIITTGLNIEVFCIPYFSSLTHILLIIYATNFEVAFSKRETPAKSQFVATLGEHGKE